MKTAAQAMVLASFVGDSLALGVHWIYDTAEISSRIGRIDSLLPPATDGYHPTKKRGQLTHYGDQALHLLRYLGSCQGRFAPDDYGREWRRFIEGYAGYMDRASKATLQNLEAGMTADNCGSPSTDLGGAARIAPLIYAFRDDREALMSAVAAQTTLTHQGPGAVAAALFLARATFAILHGSSLREALVEALAQGLDSPELSLRLQDCLDKHGDDVTAAVKGYGQACSVNAALPGAVYTALQHEDNLAEALVATVMAGGDSAARAMAVGMLLGARHGLAAIPAPWLAGLEARTEIDTLLATLP